MRLELRPLTRAGVAAICAAERRDDWAAGYPTDGDREIAALLATSSYDEIDGLGHRQIVDSASGLVIGGIGFVGGPDPDGAVSIGYSVAREWSGRGVASEALIGMLEHANATARVRTVIAEADVDHVASRRVMEKAGMRLLDTDGRRVRYGFSCVPAVRSAL